VRSTAQPPPLPWRIRTGPERLILIFAASCAVVGSGLLISLHIGSTGWPCLWKSLSGLPCAGCGGTRAASLLLHGAWGGAFALNPGATAGMACLFLLALYATSVLVFRLEPLRPAFFLVPGLRWIAVILLAANWIYLLLCARV
jgi:Protein of unknown function (DUF2752)